VEWTRAKPNHIGFFQLQRHEIVCTLTNVSQPLPDSVDFEDETWQIKHNHSLFEASLSQTTSGLSFLLATRFRMLATRLLPIVAPCRREALADGRLGAEGGSSGNSPGSETQFALKDSMAEAPKYTTPPRRAGSLRPESPGAGPATGTSPSSSCGQSPMITPPSRAASPIATPSRESEIKMDANGVMRVGREKRRMLFADMSNLKQQKSAKAGPANADKEVADAAKEVADADQEVADADKEVADADKEVADADQEVADADKEVTDADEEVADADEEVADAKN
jgi:hypothetical protein